MCGRFTLTTPLEGLRDLFGFEERPNFAPRANIAPTQDVLAVRADAGRARHAAMLRWGLVPGWAKDLSIGARMINARAETVREKPAFRRAFAKRRCLIAADGFYEWQAREAGPKQPYRVARRDGGPFAFAGLWEKWRDPSDEGASVVETCTILTTAASALLEPIHHRMPVMFFNEADFDAWLGTELGEQQAAELFSPREPSPLVVYPVSTKVNRVANDDLSLIEPVEIERSSGPGNPRQPNLL
jgi:putative SOS response-associated peptidase YedK